VPLCVVHKGVARSACCKAHLLLRFSTRICFLLAPDMGLPVAWRYGRFNPALSPSARIVLIVLSIVLETGLPGIWGLGGLTPALSVVPCLPSSIVLLAVLEHASSVCLSLWHPSGSMSCSGPHPSPWSSVASKVGFE
jgi:hypothetical protein